MKNIDTTFFKISTLKLPVKAGDLIVAEPFLKESWFDRAVISLIDHSDDEGTTGVVLNHPLLSQLDEVLDGVTRKEPVRVYCGGPLSQDRLFFVHTLGDSIIPDAREYAPGMWIGGNFDAAIEYINDGYPVEGLIRFFIGYSGWTPGQLEDELKEDAWAVQPRPGAVSDLLEGHGDPYWHKIVKGMGDYYRTWQLLPQDARSN